LARGCGGKKNTIKGANKECAIGGRMTTLNRRGRRNAEGGKNRGGRG